MGEEQTSASDLCAALHALSLDNAQAVGTEDPMFRHPERLALMFGNAVLKAIEEPDLDLTPPLLKSLNDLAALLNLMSAKSSSLWTEDAVLNDPEWRQVQDLARQALTALGESSEHAPLH
jgi:hypothetical protein